MKVSIKSRRQTHLHQVPPDISVEAPDVPQESPKANGKPRKPSTAIVALEPIRVTEIKVPIVGMSPLVTHPFSGPTKEKILARQQVTTKLNKRPPRDPESEFLGNLYPLLPSTEPTMKNYKKLRYGFPAQAFKNAMVTAAARLSGDKFLSGRVRACVFVQPDHGNLVEIFFNDLEMGADGVVLPNKTGDVRYRPYFLGWSANLVIQFNQVMMQPEMVINLVNSAGFSIGVGEWRPERDGVMGRFTVKL